jgi:hypothetical protein
MASVGTLTASTVTLMAYTVLPLSRDLFTSTLTASAAISRPPVALSWPLQAISRPLLAIPTNNCNFARALLGSQTCLIYKAIVSLYHVGKIGGNKRYNYLTRV